jgi:hypothetical protein
MSEISACVRCYAPMEWTNSRDLNIITSYLGCTECDLNVFHVETIAFMSLPNLDYESAVTKYNAWCATNPTRYGEELL